MMLVPSTVAPMKQMEESANNSSFLNEMNVDEMLKDLEEKLAEVKKMEKPDFNLISSKPLVAEDESEVDFLANDLADQMMKDAIEGTEQKDRELRAKEGGSFDIEHTFNLHEDDQIRRSQLLSQTLTQPLPQPLSQSLSQSVSQPLSQPLSQPPSQPFPQTLSQPLPQSPPYSQSQPPQLQQGQPGIQFNNNQQYQVPQQYQSQYQFQAQPRQEYQSLGNQGQYQGILTQPQTSQASPRQILEAGQQLPNNFGENMGTDLVTEPEDNDYPAEPQLSPSRQAQQDAESSGDVEEDEVIEEEEEEEVRCINKVMQVVETVYENKIKCQHTFTEKCHDTFITDYVPTQERKCETSFDKNCHITYKPMMFEETVKICDQPLKKVCNNDTIGQGEEVCKTHYETTCETRYKEHEVEQDEPVCEMVTERKCNDVRVPVPDSDPTGALLRRNKRRAQEGDPDITSGLGIGPSELGEVDGDALQSLENIGDLLSVGEECEDWPVQKCTLEKKIVKKVNPETSCRKVPREICAPSNCAFRETDKVCRDETRQLLQNIPSEVCDLEPREECKMETVLVPRLIQQPNCIKVPKEICVKAKTNPRKVKKPVVKEWCYRPSDLKSPSTRLALSQFFSN